MLRNPPPDEYEGVVPEDDYSNFDAWEGDFDDAEPDEVSHPNVNMSFKGGVPLPPRTAPGRQPPLPPRREFDDDDMPPPIVPRAGGAPPIPKQPQASLPPRQHRPPSVESDEDNYLEPSRQEEDEAYLAPQMEEEQTYEDPENNSSTPSRNPMPPRALPQPPRPPPQPPQEEEYEAPPEEAYQEADELTSYYKKESFRPPLPQRSLPPAGAAEEYEMPAAEEEYEDTDELSKQTNRMEISHSAEFDDDVCNTTTAYEVPEELTAKRLPASPAIPAGMPQKSPMVPAGQFRFAGEDTIRQKRGGLRKVIPQVNQKYNNNNNDDGDDDDDDKDDAQGGIKNIMQRLAKKSSMFRNNKGKEMEKKSQTLSPKVPPTQRPLPSPVKTESSRTSASSDSSSGSGVFMPPRRSADPLPQIPVPSPVPTERRQYNRKVEDELWYFAIERSEVEDKLERVDGMFLVRPSKLGGPRSPYTLCVFHNTRVYNLNIRLRDDDMYALGTPHPNEKTFKSVAELINHHHQYPITLAGKEKSTVTLKESPIRDDIYDQTA